MIWICVFQITITRIGTIIAQIVIQAILCPLSETKAKASIVIQVIQGISTGITVYAVIVFEKRMHNHLANHGHRPLLKLVSFKFVVGLEAMQDILFSALAESGTYFPKPPYHVSWSDFDVGIPSLILVWELTIISIVFMWSFSFEEYRRLALQGEKIQTSSWKAFLDALDVRDVWQGVKYMLTCFTSSTYLEGPVDNRTVRGLPEHRDSDDHEINAFENKISVETHT